uniref:Uncharacterized protein n=1 Tax=Mus musculus TaxID=10090 RepID=Q9D1X7_MOUSE|nr:unnamed protein product [Mus musculus]
MDSCECHSLTSTTEIHLSLRDTRMLVSFSSQLYLLPCRGQLVVWSGDHCRCGLCLPGVSDCPGHHLLQSHKEEPGHLKKAFCGLCLAWWDQPRLARRLEDRKES